jgi:Myosin head (motor domain)
LFCWGCDAICVLELLTFLLSIVTFNVVQVTGKVTEEYYFDPSLLLKEQKETKTPSKSNLNSDLSTKEDAYFFLSKHLFMPCVIIKPLVERDNSNPQQPQQQQQQQQEKEQSTGGGNGKKKKKKKGRGGGGNQSTQQQNHIQQQQPSPSQPFPGPTLVKTTSDGVLHKITDSTKLIKLQGADYQGVDDILHLPSVSEASLLHSLRLRYKRDAIYTAAGQILISINPYKAVTDNGESIYSDATIKFYRSKGWNVSGKAPHLFQTADRAYTALMDSVHSSTAVDHLEDEDAVMMTQHHAEPGHVRNQSIIISGESGAGKVRLLADSQ